MLALRIVAHVLWTFVMIIARLLCALIIVVVAINIFDFFVKTFLK